jgi:hypothetical protein
VRLEKQGRDKRRTTERERGARLLDVYTKLNPTFNKSQAPFKDWATVSICRAPFPGFGFILPLLRFSVHLIISCRADDPASSTEEDPCISMPSRFQVGRLIVARRLRDTRPTLLLRLLLSFARPV